MKTFSFIAAAAAALFLSACDRHQWEGEDGVKELYEHHEEGHGAEHGKHGKGHEKPHAESKEHKKEEGAH